MESAIWCGVNGFDCNGDKNLVDFHAWVKNKGQNVVFNLKQFLDNMVSTTKPREVVTPQVKKMQEIFIWWDLVGKGLSKTATKIFRWREEKSEKWLRMLGPCQLLWVPKMANVVRLQIIRKVGEYKEVNKVKIEGDE